MWRGGPFGFVEDGETTNPKDTLPFLSLPPHTHKDVLPLHPLPAARSTAPFPGVCPRGRVVRVWWLWPGTGRPWCFFFPPAPPHLLRTSSPPFVGGTTTTPPHDAAPLGPTPTRTLPTAPCAWWWPAAGGGVPPGRLALPPSLPPDVCSGCCEWQPTPSSHPTTPHTLPQLTSLLSDARPLGCPLCLRGPRLLVLPVRGRDEQRPPRRGPHSLQAHGDQPHTPAPPTATCAGFEAWLCEAGGTDGLVTYCPCVCAAGLWGRPSSPPPRWSSWLLLTPCPLGRAWLPLCLSRRWYSPSLTKSNRPNQPPLFSQWPPRPPLRRQRPRRYVHLHPYHACACKQARTHALRAPHFRTRPLSPCPSLLRRLPPAPRSPACTSST